MRSTHTLPYSYTCSTMHHLGMNKAVLHDDRLACAHLHVGVKDTYERTVWVLGPTVFVCLCVLCVCVCVTPQLTKERDALLADLAAARAAGGDASTQLSSAQDEITRLKGALSDLEVRVCVCVCVCVYVFVHVQRSSKQGIAIQREPHS